MANISLDVLRLVVEEDDFFTEWSRYLFVNKHWYDTINNSPEMKELKEYWTFVVNNKFCRTRSGIYLAATVTKWHESYLFDTYLQSEDNLKDIFIDGLLFCEQETVDLLIDYLKLKEVHWEHQLMMLDYKALGTIIIFGSDDVLTHHWFLDKHRVPVDSYFHWCARYSQNKNVIIWLESQYEFSQRHIMILLNATNVDIIKYTLSEYHSQIKDPSKIFEDNHSSSDTVQIIKYLLENNIYVSEMTNIIVQVLLQTHLDDKLLTLLKEIIDSDVIDMNLVCHRITRGHSSDSLKPHVVDNLCMIIQIDCVHDQILINDIVHLFCKNGRTDLIVKVLDSRIKKGASILLAYGDSIDILKIIYSEGEWELFRTVINCPDMHQKSDKWQSILSNSEDMETKIEEYVKSYGGKMCPLEDEAPHLLECINVMKGFVRIYHNSDKILFRKLFGLHLEDESLEIMCAKSSQILTEFNEYVDKCLELYPMQDDILHSSEYAFDPYYDTETYEYDVEEDEE